ncbi:hypothetical protein [Thiocystis violascens]|uniref:Uncharacterized protein n=1 Tax=Thiocystis violascens (strain ATCC 17096 / DSM 198 / 6111) TaxID=765911 RepID=I3Y5I3_THIV6|nr:hypothetical protein [Thiocystis violascens]AFL72251.1 hypothetical protein Thivi_0179 [Thiocystis violascens DSM 198]
MGESDTFAPGSAPVPVLPLPWLPYGEDDMSFMRLDQADRAALLFFLESL